MKKPRPRPKIVWRKCPFRTEEVMCPNKTCEGCKEKGTGKAE